MKNRTLFSNICSVVIIVALIVLLLAYSNVIGGSRDSDAAKLVINIALPIAIVAVALFDIIFPVLDNRDKLKEKKYIIKLAIKSLLFAGSMVIAVLTLYSRLGKTVNEFAALGIFVVLYFAQFFISLDTKQDKKRKTEKVMITKTKETQTKDKSEKEDSSEAPAKEE